MHIAVESARRALIGVGQAGREVRCNGQAVSSWSTATSTARTWRRMVDVRASLTDMLRNDFRLTIA